MDYDKYRYSRNNDDLLGQGSYASVYKCIDKTNPDKLLCIKIIKQKEIILDAQFREFIILNELRDNEFLVKMENCFIKDDELCIVMERCDGSLQQLGKSLTPQQALQVIQQVVNGFKSLVQKNIIHRDIKPDNILYKGNIFKISDFGQARFFDCPQQQLSNQGTPAYQSPQIILKDKNKYTNKTDIYSLGMTFYKLIYGKLPFDQKYKLYKWIKRIEKHPLRLWECRKGLTLPIRDLVEKMLRYREEDRISWDELFDHPLMKQNLHFEQFQQHIPVQQNIENLCTWEQLKFLIFVSQNICLIQQLLFIIQQWNHQLSLENSGYQTLHQQLKNSLYSENPSISDEYHMAGVLHSCAFKLLLQNENLKTQDKINYFEIILYLARASIQLYEAARYYKKEKQGGEFPLNYIEGLFYWQINELKTLDLQIQKYLNPQEMNQLQEKIKQFNEIQGTNFYEREKNKRFFPFQSQQDDQQQYTLLIYLWEKIQELTRNDFQNISMDQIIGQIENTKEMENYITQRRDEVY